ncbi:hypothetical protein [Mesorhizobium sp. M0019]|uniref:hypothetical protein n=1 Tax=Mesorhizobium sp. M0019 TaxID=2956845 RepID=UPI00333C5DAE
MPVTIVDNPAHPRCGGHQWFIDDLDALASLMAIVMVGRARRVGSILDGAEHGPVTILPTTKARLQRELVLADGVHTWHRDGLLFETMCWIVARMGAGPDEVLSDPHRRATQQGADTVKVVFDPARRELVGVTVYEQKCSDDARGKFRDEVLPAFKNWFVGVRDDELMQIAIGLLDRYNLTDMEHEKAYADIILKRPLSFRAALTVSPQVFPAAECVKLFKDYEELELEVAARFGDTFPLDDIRGWFKAFAAVVWSKIEQFNV